MKQRLWEGGGRFAAAVNGAIRPAAAKMPLEILLETL